MIHHSLRLALLLTLVLSAAALPAADPARSATPTTATLAARGAQPAVPGDTLAVSFYIASADADTTYTIEPGDELYLNFRYSPELSQIYIKQTDDENQREEKWSDKVSILSRAYIVQPDGMLLLSGIRQPLKVSGLSTPQIAARIETIYRKAGLLSNPDLNVTVDPKYRRYEPLQRAVQSVGERPLLFVPVPADGRIGLPLVSDVPVAGKSAGQIGKELTARYRALGLGRVTVSVWFHQLAGQGQPRVRVLGEVKSPGVYPLRGPLDVWDAVALAGGFTAAADVNAVRVVGRTAFGPLRFDDYLATADPQANAPLSGGELIFVPLKKQGQP